jgi:hypothetical protein
MKKENEEETIPFTQVLDAILTNETVPIHLLYRFSDMSDEEAIQFYSRWQETDNTRRQVITRHLADLTEENFVVDFSPIFAYCFEDEDEYVREAALDGVWDATNIRLISPIINLMQTDESGRVRAPAARALAHYVLLSEWGQLPKRVSPRIIEALLLEYDQADTAVPIKRATLEALGAANHPRVVQLIEEAYDDPDIAMQLSAVFAMGISADKRWTAIVLAEMDHPEPDMRAEAARAAGIIGGSDAVDKLSELAGDEDLGVQTAAILALGQIGGETAQTTLTELLEDFEFEEVHEIIEEAMEEIALINGEFDILDYVENKPDDLDDSYLLN